MIIGWSATQTVQNHSSLKLSVVFQAFSLDMRETGTTDCMNTRDQTSSLGRPALNSMTSARATLPKIKNMISFHGRRNSHAFTHAFHTVSTVMTRMLLVKRVRTVLIWPLLKEIKFYVSTLKKLASRPLWLLSLVQAMHQFHQN